MFDFCKLSASAKYSEQLLVATNLDFRQSITKEGVIITTADGYNANRATINGFDIIVWQHPTKPHRIDIKGSFHKLHEGQTNYKDFTFTEFRSAVNIFCDSINIPPTELYIHSFEVGVNILLPIETSSVIEGLKTLSGRKFDRDTFRGKGLLFAFDFAQYRVKIYNKGLQYSRPEQIIRFELKVKKMAYIQTKGVNITTLENLMTGDMNTLLGNLLLTQWDKVIICPEGMINPNLITNTRTRENFINGLNPDYWTGLNRKAYKRQFVRFKAMFKQLAPIDLYSVIRDFISKKWDTLSTPILKEQRGQYYPLVYGNNIPFTTNQPKQGLCVSCGRDITNQKKNSKFCSETIHGPEVKKCRNMQSNPMNNRKRKEQRIYPGLTLFPLYIHYGII